MKNHPEICAETLDEVVFGRPQFRALLKSLIDGRMNFPANGKSGVLLAGIYGTGKTMVAKMLPGLFEAARSGGSDADEQFHECKRGNNGVLLLDHLDASCNLISFNPSGLHYVILDEVDNLTELAQTQLKGLMNRRSVIFIMTSNHAAALNRGIIDRSHVIELNSANPAAWLPVARKVWRTHSKIEPSDELLMNIIKQANGTARQIIAAVNGYFADLE